MHVYGYTSHFHLSPISRQTVSLLSNHAYEHGDSRECKSAACVFGEMAMAMIRMRVPEDGDDEEDEDEDEDEDEEREREREMAL